MMTCKKSPLADFRLHVGLPGQTTQRFETAVADSLPNETLMFRLNDGASSKSPGSRSKTRGGKVVLLIMCALVSLACEPSPKPILQVSAPAVDAHGVKSFPVISIFTGSAPTIVRVLEPTNPAPGKPRRFLYVLPVQAGVTSLSSEHSDGLEELRLLDVHNRYNLTLIAPSFPDSPWYGDHATDESELDESFVVKHLVPFGDSFAAPGESPERWVLGFSKSGFGALNLILRNPNLFNAAAAWDAPAQFTGLSAYPELEKEFGTEENFDRYEIPRLIAANSAEFRTRNRIWISGDQSAWTWHMIQLHKQMTEAGIIHTWVEGGPRPHTWSSGWLESAVASLHVNGSSVPEKSRKVTQTRSNQ